METKELSPVEARLRSAEQAVAAAELRLSAKHLRCERLGLALMVYQNFNARLVQGDDWRTGDPFLSPAERSAVEAALALLEDAFQEVR